MEFTILDQEIADLRKIMIDTAGQHNALTNKEVVERSEQLDKLIIEKMKLELKRKRLSVG